MGATTVAMLAAVGCSTTHHPAPPLAPAAATTPATTPAATPTVPPLTCTASVSRKHPADGRTVGVTVSTAPNARVTVAVHYQGAIRKKSSRASAVGLRTFWFQVGSATPGYPVKVSVGVSAHGSKRSCRASFIPRQPPLPPAPTPSPVPTQAAAPAPPPAPKHNSGAWCSASVNTYQDSDHDEWYNDVYVKSNQPDARVTASGGGYSHSWWTDGSGSADVYLDGPPPGTAITVTVGGATCSA